MTRDGLAVPPVGGAGTVAGRAPSAGVEAEGCRGCSLQGLRGCGPPPGLLGLLALGELARLVGEGVQLEMAFSMSCWLLRCLLCALSIALRSALLIAPSTPRPRDKPAAPPPSLLTLRPQPPPPPLPPPPPPLHPPPPPPQHIGRSKKVVGGQEEVVEVDTDNGRSKKGMGDQIKAAEGQSKAVQDKERLSETMKDSERQQNGSGMVVEGQ